jgi:hypothetical protein
MARVYTVGPQLAGDIIFTDNQNDELNQSISALNGTLDQNNMPLDSVTRAKVVAPTTVATVGPPAWDSYYFQSQSYHIAEKCTGTVNFLANTWSMGWNAFEAAASAADRTGFVLEFAAQEGMLKGEAVLDFEHRQSYYLFGYKAPAGAAQHSFRVKDQHTGELGVFVNDVLVARTGPVWMACGRHTYTLPWASPVKSGTVKVDVRWLLDYSNIKFVTTSGTTYFGGINQVYPVSVHSRLLWCRNQYR